MLADGIPAAHSALTEMSAHPVSKSSFQGRLHDPKPNQKRPAWVEPRHIRLAAAMSVGVNRYGPLVAKPDRTAALVRNRADLNARAGRLRLLRRKSAELVDEHRFKIERLADALMERETLSANEVDGVLFPP
jgi:hypothetical protein